MQPLLPCCELCTLTKCIMHDFINVLFFHFSIRNIQKSLTVFETDRGILQRFFIAYVMRRRTLLFTIGIFILIIPEFLRWYLIMPLPGSQIYNTAGFAHFLHCFINVFRVVGGLLILFPLISFWQTGKLLLRITTSILVLFYAALFYITNYKFSAEHLFLEPEKKAFLPVESSVVDSTNLVIGVALNGQAKAYPIQYIGYHHMVQDTVGNTPVYVTYCTVCRSGRAYSQFLDGKRIQFRLRGMDHFNAMFEDVGTTSWWSQESGQAIAGKLKGTTLNEIPSQQMTLNAWIRLHPNTLILQPDPKFAQEYKQLRKYDYGTVKYGLTYTDSTSWKDHSWVVGIETGKKSKVYDWNTLKKVRLINDTIGDVPVLLLLEKDNMSFHAYLRKAGDQLLVFEWNNEMQSLIDSNTHSSWNYDGQCLEGTLKGNQLVTLPAYQEFWHSWETFHPNSQVYQSH